MTASAALVGRDPATLDVLFELECSTCGGDAVTEPVVFDVKSVIIDRPAVGYAVLRLDGDATRSFGVAALDAMTAPIGTTVYAIHHSKGLAKGIGGGMITATGIDDCADDLFEPTSWSTCSGAARRCSACRCTA